MVRDKYECDWGSQLGLECIIVRSSRKIPDWRIDERHCIWDGSLRNNFELYSHRGYRNKSAHKNRRLHFNHQLLLFKFSLVAERSCLRDYREEESIG